MAYDFARYLNIRSAGNPVLAPDGSRVAFLSDISGNFQVWSVGLSGENARSWPCQLTFFADKVWEIHGTSAVPHLIAVSDVGGNERQQFYLISNFGVDAAGQESHNVRRLTSNDQAIHRFGAWSREGQQFYYTSNARNNVDFDLYQMDLRIEESQLIQQGKGWRGLATLSPDERYAIFTEDVSSVQIELFLLDLVTGEERHLTAGAPAARYDAIWWITDGIYLLTDRTHDRSALCRFDLTTGQLQELLNAEIDATRGELELFRIAPNERTAALTYNAEGWSHLYLLDLVQQTTRQVPSIPQGVMHNFTFSADSKTLIFDLQSATQPQDIWQLHLSNEQCRRLTFSNRAGISAESMTTPTLVSYESFDQQQPAPATGYPAILYVHGGPASQLRPEFNVSFQYFLSQGYAILATNVRGSTGYGRAYALLDEVELRMNSVTDLKYAVSWLHEQPDIDPQRIAIYGRSYGGFMVLAALTAYPELFAAGVDVVGIANWVTFLERTSAWRRAHREYEYGSLTHHRELLERISPIHRIERIKAPLMVQAGDNDPRVPLSESEQVVTRVQQAGGVVEFVHYADEGHMFSKLVNRIDSYTQIGAFLQRYLKSQDLRRTRET